MKRIQASVIGLGPWGQKIVTRVNELPQFQFVSLADRSSEDLTPLAQKTGATPFRSWDEMIEFYVPDLVLIATPVESHFELAEKALKRGCHVWLTKPPVSNLSQFEKMVALAEQKNLKLFFDHTFLFSGRFKTISQFLPILSPLQSIETQRGQMGGWKAGSSVLQEMIYHDIYMALAWMKKIPVAASLTSNEDTDPKLQTGQLSIDFGDHRTLQAQGSFGWKDRTRLVKLRGVDWELEWNDNHPTQPLVLKKKGEPAGTLEELLDPQDAIQKQFLNIYDCLTEKKEPLVTVEQVRQVMKVIELAKG